MTRLLVSEKNIKLSPPSLNTPNVTAFKEHYKLLSKLSSTMATGTESAYRAFSKPVDDSTQLRPINTASTNEMLRKRKTTSLFTLDLDFWIDVGLVTLLGGVSFLALKCVEYFVLTDAIVGLF